MNKTSLQELFYFSSFELMAHVEYCRGTNALRYATHRHATQEERAVIEQFLLAKVALRTDYYKKSPSLLVYIGVDSKLERRKHKYEQSVEVSLEDRAQESVTAVINAAMQDYYLCRIGETLVHFRHEVGGEDSKQVIATFKREMNELVDAYNAHSTEKIKMSEIVPKELRVFL